MKEEIKTPEIEQEYDVYVKRTSYFFPHYKKTDEAGKTLNEINSFFKKIQVPNHPSDSHEVFKENNKSLTGKLIYKFVDIPGSDSIARKKNFPLSYTFYKIVPKLKIKLEELK